MQTWLWVLPKRNEPKEQDANARRAEIDMCGWTWSRFQTMSLLLVLVFIVCFSSEDRNLIYSYYTLLRAGSGNSVNLLVFIVLRVVNAPWRSPQNLFNKLFWIFLIIICFGFCEGVTVSDGEPRLGGAMAEGAWDLLWKYTLLPTGRAQWQIIVILAATPIYWALSLYQAT